MTVSAPRAFVVLARKELRALAPVWALALVTTLAGALVQHRSPLGANVVRDVALFGLSLGSVGLGALSFGHEFQFRSLGTMLSLPVPRGVWALAKFAVLAVLLAALGVVGWFGRMPLLPWSALESPYFSHYNATYGYVLQFLWALTVAPLFALRLRGAVFGGLAAIGLPIALRLCGEMAGEVYYGFGGTHGADVLFVGIWTLNWGGLAVAVIAAWMTWGAVRHLELTSSDASVSTAPSWLAPRVRSTGAKRAAAHRWAPLRALVGKELRLQQPALVVTAVYVAIRLAFFLIRRRNPNFGIVVSVFDTVNVLLVSLLAGALAFANELGNGVTLSEAVLPLATTTRWMVKASAAAAVALLLGAGVPLLLHVLHPSIDDVVSLGIPAIGFFPSHTVTLLWGSALLWAVSVHLSSLNASAFRGVVASAATVSVGMVMTNWIAVGLDRTIGSVARLVSGDLLGGRSQNVTRAVATAFSYNDAALVIGWGAVLLFVAVPLVLSYRNFRTAAAPTVWRQLAVLAATQVIGWTLAYVAMWAWMFAAMAGWIR